MEERLSLLISVRLSHPNRPRKGVKRSGHVAIHGIARIVCTYCYSTRVKSPSHVAPPRTVERQGVMPSCRTGGVVALFGVHVVVVTSDATVYLIRIRRILKACQSCHRNFTCRIRPIYIVNERGVVVFAESNLCMCRDFVAWQGKRIPVGSSRPILHRRGLILLHDLSPTAAIRGHVTIDREGRSRGGNRVHAGGRRGSCLQNCQAR